MSVHASACISEVPTKLHIGNFYVCQENPNLVKIKQKYQVLLPEHLACFILLAVTCSTTIHRTYCCVFMAMFLIFNILVKATSAHQIYKENSFLDFHGNNAYANVPQCYKYTVAYLYFKVGTTN